MKLVTFYNSWDGVFCTTLVVSQLYLKREMKQEHIIFMHEM
jgi:hypothetical protein